MEGWVPSKLWEVQYGSSLFVVVCARSCGVCAAVGHGQGDALHDGVGAAGWRTGAQLAVCVVCLVLRGSVLNNVSPGQWEGDRLHAVLRSSN